MDDVEAEIAGRIPQSAGELYRAYGVGTKKRFGQHFLIDPAILGAIVDCADLKPGERVLEVGPGCGTLTWTMLERGVEVDAVEVDRDAIAFLKQALEPYFSLRVHGGDALTVDLGAILGVWEGPWKVVANLPYNVGTEVMFRLFEYGEHIEAMTLMFQREVAQRIVAVPGDSSYGQLSLMAQLYADVELVMTLKAGAFVPPPKVQSAVVQFQILRKTRIEDRELREVFQRVVRVGFQARRKMLTTSLRGLGFGRQVLEAALNEVGLSTKARPEELGFAEFLDLSRVLKRMAGVDGGI